MQATGSSVFRLAFDLSSDFGGYFSLILENVLLKLSYNFVVDEDVAVSYTFRAPGAGWAGYSLMYLRGFAKEHRANSDP